MSRGVPASVEKKNVPCHERWRERGAEEGKKGLGPESESGRRLGALARRKAKPQHTGKKVNATLRLRLNAALRGRTHQRLPDGPTYSSGQKNAPV